MDLAIGRLGAGADSAATRSGSMCTVSKTPLSFGDGGDVEFSHAGVHNPTRASIADVSACEHNNGRFGDGDREADGRDGVADRTGGFRRPAVA
jgi:hypothetical protein